jgi:predicted protein tyrosine phosphatase
MNIPGPKIVICAAREMLDTLRSSGASAVLSIEHPLAVPGEEGYAPRVHDLAHRGRFLHVPQKILAFWDYEINTSDGHPIPNTPDIVQVGEGMLFAARHAKTGGVLIHCAAGKSRSTGVALGALALLHPEKDEKALVTELLRLRPIAAPNILVVEHADIVANRNGRLVDAVLAHPGIERAREKAEISRQRWLSKTGGCKP